MFYGNVIQQYQPEAPIAFNNRGIPNRNSAIINSIGFITSKSKGTGVGLGSQYVQYAYVFEDEMQIKSQVELTKIISLKENSVDIAVDTDSRDIALYFVPGAYTNGIKRTIIYRKLLSSNTGTPSNRETIWMDSMRLVKL